MKPVIQSRHNAHIRAARHCIIHIIYRLLFIVLLSGSALSAGTVVILDVQAPQDGIDLNAHSGLTLTAGTGESTIGGTTSSAHSYLSQVGDARRLADLGLLPGDTLRFTAELLLMDVQGQANGGLTRDGTQLSTQFRFMADYNRNGLVDIGVDSEYANRITSSATTTLYNQENTNTSSYQTILTEMVIPERDQVGEPLSLMEWSIRLPSTAGDRPHLKLRKVRITAESARIPQQYYVANDGNDHGSGSLEDPFKTIRKGISVLEPGETLFIRGGIYREQNRIHKSGTAGKPITLSGYQSEQVILSGADVFTDWTPEGALWKLPWTRTLDITNPSYISGEARRTEMVIFNGQVLHQVTAKSDLDVDTDGRYATGKYWIEGSMEAPTAIYARFPGNQSPAGNLVECATRRNVINSGDSDWLVFKKFTIRHCATPGGGGAITVFPGSNHQRFEDIIAEWNNAAGFRARGLGGRLNNHAWIRCHARDNGQAGFLISGGNNYLLEDCSTLRNNWKNFDIKQEAGGGKWAVCDKLVIRRMVAGDNNGVGIWLDIDNTDCLIEHCVVYDSQLAGIMLEMRTSRTTCRNNIVWGTSFYSYNGSGIFVSAASENYVYHNTTFNNDRPFRIRPDRRDPAENNFIYNNIFLAGIRNDAVGSEIAGNLTHTDPVFRSDWHLAANSPARGYGVTLPVAFPFQGNAVDFDEQARPSRAPDAGADQYYVMPHAFPRSGTTFKLKR